MEKNEWLKISAYTTVDGIDNMYPLLVSEGIEAFEVQDPREVQQLLDGKDKYWDYIDDETIALAKKPCITVYAAVNPQGLALRRTFLDIVAKTISACCPVEVRESSMREDDWANNWKKYFKPLKVGKKMLIKPSWEDITDNDEERIILEIDPSVSFGTGGHATTRLCIEAMENNIVKGCELLDLGCGSGILFIAGMLLGARHAVAVDIDENSVRTSKENALRNCITNYELYIGNVLEDDELCSRIGYKKYDVVLANIVADVIIKMCPLFARFIKDGGVLISSGIIPERKDEVILSIENAGFTVVKVAASDDWVSVSAVYKG